MPIAIPMSIVIAAADCEPSYTLIYTCLFFPSKYVLSLRKTMSSPKVNVSSLGEAAKAGRNNQDGRNNQNNPDSPATHFHFFVFWPFSLKLCTPLPQPPKLMQHFPHNHHGQNDA